jgi:uncharacterized RDD family membrane protein YckC
VPAPPGSLAPPRWSTPTPTLASYGRRLGGWLIDWVILAVASSIILLPFGGLVHTTNVYAANGISTSHSVSFHVSGWGLALHAVLIVGYGTLLCGSSRGQTVGMMAVGVRAVDQAAGTPIGHGRAFGRALLEYVLALVLFLPWVLDMLWPLWDSQNQTLHDKASRTIVVHA